jgi:hypothetical protein
MNTDQIQMVEFDSTTVADVAARPEVRDAITAFEPLPFPAGEEAATWLRQVIDHQRAPCPTRLFFAGDEMELAGFYAAEPIAFTLSGTDFWILKIRLPKTKEGPQPGTTLRQIARSRATASGFGEDIFNYAFLKAKMEGSVAMIIDPHDETVAKMWRDNYRFMAVSRVTDAYQSERLFLPVEKPQGSWPS